MLVKYLAFHLMQQPYLLKPAHIYEFTICIFLKNYHNFHPTKNIFYTHDQEEWYNR